MTVKHKVLGAFTVAFVPSTDKGWRLTQKSKSSSCVLVGPRWELQQMRFFAAVNKNQLWPWLSWNIWKLRSISLNLELSQTSQCILRKGANKGICLSNISMQHEKRKFSLGWQNEVSSLDSNNLISKYRQLKPDAMLSAIKSSWKISTSFFMHWCQFQNSQMTDEQISTTISELFRFILWWVRWEGEGRFPGEMRQEGEVSGELKSEKLAFLETILSRSVFWYMLRNIHVQMFWNPLESSQFESLTSRVCLKGPNIDKRKVSNLRIFLPSVHLCFPHTTLQCGILWKTF